MVIINNDKLINFLEENGYPVYFISGDGSTYYYKKTKKLSMLLDRYTIIKECIPNKI